MGDTKLSSGNRKLVVLGIPWDIDTDGLRQFMSKYGSLDDVVVMKERATGRSRGFGYVTFSTDESAEKALATKHLLNGRLLEVKVATPKEDMKPPSKKITRIFVARIPFQVTEETFQRYFEKFGEITDVYMPKDQGAKSHRGIGFITFENSASVDKIMSETHEIGGSTVAVDRATPKEESGGKYADKGYSSEKRYSAEKGAYGEKGFSGAYGSYSPYIAAAAATRYGAFGLSPFGGYDYTGAGLGSDYGPAGLGGGFGGASWSRPPPPRNPAVVGGSGAGLPVGFSSGGQPAPAERGIGNKIFVGRLPSEVTSEDLRHYFSNFGRILDVYLPKDSKKSGHRGFAFVTFADEGPAKRVALRAHELLGHQIVVEHATPPDEAGSGSEYSGSGSAFGMSSAGASLRETGSTYAGSGYRAGLDYKSAWGVYGGGGVGPIMAGDGGPLGGSRASRMETRYRPY